MADTEDTAPDGFEGAWGFLDGLGGIAGRLGGIVDTGANAAEDIARGRGAMDDQRLNKSQQELDQLLQLRGFNRTDNVTQMWVIGAAAVAVILLVMK